MRTIRRIRHRRGVARSSEFLDCASQHFRVESADEFGEFLCANRGPFLGLARTLGAQGRYDLIDQIEVPLRHRAHRPEVAGSNAQPTELPNEDDHLHGTAWVPAVGVGNDDAGLGHLMDLGEARPRKLADLLRTDARAGWRRHQLAVPSDDPRSWRLGHRAPGVEILQLIPDDAQRQEGIPLRGKGVTEPLDVALAVLTVAACRATRRDKALFFEETKLRHREGRKLRFELAHDGPDAHPRCARGAWRPWLRLSELA